MILPTKTKTGTIPSDLNNELKGEQLPDIMQSKLTESDGKHRTTLDDFPCVSKALLDDIPCVTNGTVADTMDGRISDNCENTSYHEYKNPGRKNSGSNITFTTVPVKGCNSNFSDSESEFFCGSESDDESWEGPIDKDTLENILKCSIPEEYFTHSLPSKASFSMDKSDWKCLKKTQQGRTFKKGSWQHIFMQGYKKSNPYCVFAFKYHKVTEAKIRKQKVSPIFVAKGYCKFEHCSVELDLKMWNSKTVHVQYYGNLKHCVGDEHARPFRQGQRKLMAKSFLDGKKPLKEYMERIEAKPGRTLISGNNDDLGNTKNTIRKISSESFTTGRRDENVFTSLLILKAEMRKKFKGGFIQNIGYDPVCVYYWTENGIRLWHQIAKTDAAFLDATGSVVRKNI